MSASKVHSKNAAHSNGAMPKVVGPNVQGNREEYQLVRRLQSALFGGVYEAKGLSSNRDFAIKVLHKSELTKAQESSSIEFCEVPLSEIRFAELMRGHPHVMEPEEHFEDAYCFYVVFDLCRGGDLLEALKQKPHGFDEAHAQYLIKQAALGLAFLHERHVAMQDTSLENMLLHVQESTGHYQVKICDPGQAVIFEVDKDGEELPVNFRGLVGKSFRPPELHEQQPYAAIKVDSWCLGWSTFYLLTAQPLFMSADPAQQDSDWLLFQQGDFATLFQQKCNLCSPTGLDFIFRLLQIEPRRRMSIADALNHSWLADATIGPVLAPKDVLAEMLGVMDNRALEVVDGYDGDNQNQQVQGGSPTNNKHLVGDGTQQSLIGTGTSYSPPTSAKPQLSGIPYGGNNELPTWASANPNSGMYNNTGGPIFGGVAYGAGPGAGVANQAVPFGQQYADGTPMLRVPIAQRARGEVRSPPRSPRTNRSSGGPGGPGPGPRLAFERMPFDRFGAQPLPQDGRERARYPNPARMAHIISTAHSPAPQGPGYQGRGSPPPRAGSPMQRQLSPNQNQDLGSSTGYNTGNLSNTVSAQQLPQGQPYSMDQTRTAMLTPRSGSGRLSPPGQSPLNSAVPPPNNQASQDMEDRSRGRAWAFRSESPSQAKIMGRDGVSPAPEYGRQRATSPFGNVGAVMRPGSTSWQVPYAPRQSPHGQRIAQSPARGSGLPTFPRSMSPGLLEASSLTQQGSSAIRTSSPGGAVRALSPSNSLAGSTQVEIGGGGRGGFNWNTAPPLSPRGPGPAGGGVSRISSPGNPQQVGVSRIASPTGGLKTAGQAPQPIMQGFAWSPEPPSPRTSPRSYSPSPTNIAAPSTKAGYSLPRWNQ